MVKRINNKGMALLWVVVLSFVMMVVTATMATYMVKESRMSINMQDSAQAYAYARTGVDWGLSRLSVTPNTTQNFNLDGNPGNEVSVVISTPVGPGSATTITSTGVWNGTKRTLEYVTSNTSLAVITPNPPPALPQTTNFSSQITPSENRGSFKMNFDFWFSSAHSSQATFGIGTAASNAGNNIRIRINPSGASTIFVKRYYSPTLFEESSAPINYNTPPPPIVYPSGDSARSEYARYRAEVKYIAETTVFVKIKKLDSATGVYTCIASGSFDLASSPDITQGKNLDDLIYLYADGNTAEAHLINGTQEDGRYIELSDGLLNKTYIDNIVIYDRTIYIAPPVHLLTVTKAGTGTGSVSSTPPGITDLSLSFGFNQGTPLSIIANPAIGSAFSSWSGCDSVSGNTCNITNFNAARTITVTFNLACTVTSESRTLACPYSGLIYQQRDTTCPSGAWGSWYNTSDTCTIPVIITNLHFSLSGGITFNVTAADGGYVYVNGLNIGVVNGTPVDSFGTPTSVSWQINRYRFTSGEQVQVAPTVALTHLGTTYYRADVRVWISNLRTSYSGGNNGGFYPHQTGSTYSYQCTASACTGGLTSGTKFDGVGIWWSDPGVVVQ